MERTGNNLASFDEVVGTVAKEVDDLLNDYAWGFSFENARVANIRSTLGEDGLFPYSFSDFLDKFKDIFQYGEEAIELASNHDPSWEALKLCYERDILIVSDPYTGGGSFEVGLTGICTIRINSYHKPVDLLGTLLHEIKHYKNRVGHNIRTLFSPMSYEEFYRWHLNDELTAHKDQAMYMCQLLDLSESKASVYADLIKDYSLNKLEERILTRKFKDGKFHYPSEWKKWYEAKDFPNWKVMSLNIYSPDLWIDGEFFSSESVEIKGCEMRVKLFNTFYAFSFGKSYDVCIRTDTFMKTAQLVFSGTSPVDGSLIFRGHLDNVKVEISVMDRLTMAISDLEKNSDELVDKVNSAETELESMKKELLELRKAIADLYKAKKIAEYMKL